MKRLVMLGPPASGKGTQGARLARELDVPHISSGHLLRRSMDRGDPFGVRPLVVAGEKVPDEVVERLLEPALGAGFVLDGYPRTVEQARRLDEMLERVGHPLELALELALDEATLAARMALRAGAEKRSDDRPEVFMRRLEIYARDIPALRVYYEGRLATVDGQGDQDDVYERVRTAAGLS